MQKIIIIYTIAIGAIFSIDKLTHRAIRPGHTRVGDIVTFRKTVVIRYIYFIFFIKIIYTQDF